MDNLLEQAQIASTLAAKGNYPEAKLLFPGVTFWTRVNTPRGKSRGAQSLENFVGAAFANHDLDEATSQLFKSYKDHKAALGAEDKRTWQSLARLGHFYKQQGLIGQAYHFLLNAREGLLKVTAASSEEAYNHTRWITSELIDIAREQRNFDEAESESKRQILLAEDLGVAYERDVVMLKYNLVHLYSDDSWRDTADGISKDTTSQDPHRRYSS